MTFERRYLQDHNAVLVEDAEPQVRVILKWANRMKYVVLSRTPRGSLCFTEEELKQAKMWWEKLNG